MLGYEGWFQSSGLEIFYFHLVLSFHVTFPSKISHLWISPIVLVRILEWIFKEPCFLKLVWEARKPELATEARLVWLRHVEIIRHCGEARISEACEYRWMGQILTYTLGAVPCLSTEKDLQIQDLHARDQTTTNGSASQCRGEEMLWRKMKYF